MNATNDQAVTPPSPEPGSTATSTSAAETLGSTAPPPSEQSGPATAASPQTTVVSQADSQATKAPAIAENDLRLEGLVRVTGTAGLVFEYLLDLPLHSTLSPAQIPNAQGQFEAIVSLMLVKPATVAFIAHLGRVKTEQADAARRKKFAGQPA